MSPENDAKALDENDGVTVDHPEFLNVDPLRQPYREAFTASPALHRSLEVGVIVGIVLQGHITHVRALMHEIDHFRRILQVGVQLVFRDLGPARPMLPHRGSRGGLSFHTAPLGFRQERSNYSLPVCRIP